MVFLLTYWVFMLLALLFSWRAGTMIDKVIIIAVMVATLATIFANLNFAGRTNLVIVLSISAALFAVSLWCSLQSAQFWPLWFTGFMGASIFTDFAALLSSDEQLWVYRTLAGFWVIPALLAMVFGIYLDSRTADHQSSKSSSIV